jgi:MOSC domain-containing protein YiiM
MAPSGPVDLYATFESDSLLELRTGRMKKLQGLEVLSGIDKGLCSGPMKITKLGLEGDEHDPVFHGGPDKAILGCELLRLLSARTLATGD